jgi:sulfatase-modifying factor enzyme 1
VVRVAPGAARYRREARVAHQLLGPREAGNRHQLRHQEQAPVGADPGDRRQERGGGVPCGRRRDASLERANQRGEVIDSRTGLAGTTTGTTASARCEVGSPRELRRVDDILRRRLIHALKDRRWSSLDAGRAAASIAEVYYAEAGEWWAWPNRNAMGLKRMSCWAAPVLAVMLCHVISGFSASDRALVGNYAVGQSFRDCNANCPEMVVLPPGRFTIGSPISELRRGGDENPQRVISIGYTLAVGKYPVTRREFAAFLEDTGRPVGPCEHWDGKSFRVERGVNWSNAFHQTDKHPVVCVNWHDSQAYAQWLSHKTGKSYRLLSEAEWEYAARGDGRLPSAQLVDARLQAVQVREVEAVEVG